MARPRAGSFIGLPGLVPANRWAMWPQTARICLDLVVPQICGGCGQPGWAWCPMCVQHVQTQACANRALGRGALIAVSAADHRGPAGRAVSAFKDDGQRRLARPLATLLARAIAALLDQAAVETRLSEHPTWLVPVPSRASARRVRGADHMETLGALAARQLRSAGLDVHRLSALKLIGATSDMVGLTRAQRSANVVGSMHCQPIPRGQVVVVDDVLTTGSTLTEALRAVNTATTSVVGAATVTYSDLGRHLASTHSQV